MDLTNIFDETGLTPQFYRQCYLIIYVAISQIAVAV